MAQALADPDFRSGRREIGRIFAAALLLALILGVGWALISTLAAREKDRSLRAWQTQLGLIADSRAGAVEQWLNGQFSELTAIAENASVQLYLAQIRAHAGAPSGRSKGRNPVSAEREYLANLLAVSAHRAGFTAEPAGPRVNANIRRAGIAGLAITDRDGGIIAASPSMPALTETDRRVLFAPDGGKRHVHDLHIGPGGHPRMGFSVPVYSIQGNGGAADRIGYIVGYREVANSLYPRLSQPGMIWRSAEVLLLRRTGEQVEIVSPLKSAPQAFGTRMALDTPALDAGFALAHPAGFGILRKMSGEDVLVTSRAIASVPWTLMVRVNRAEALGAEETAERRLAWMLALGCLAMAGAFVAVWRHGASRRTARFAVERDTLARVLMGREQLLTSITDHQAGSVMIVEVDDTIGFANPALAARFGVDAQSLAGKLLEAAFGPAASARYRSGSAEARRTGQASSEITEERSFGDSEVTVWRTDFIPLAGDAGQATEVRVLVVEQDISDAVRARDHRAAMLEQVVGTLLDLLDQRDPHAARHSRRVRDIAGALARELGLGDDAIETASIAGSLMNIGKVMVPDSLLTRTGALNEEEMAGLRRSLEQGIDMIAGISFSGPVVDTLRALYPPGGGNEPSSPPSLVSARIVAVANGYVAMTSDRSYRQGMDSNAALDEMLQNTGSVYDRNVVVALMNLMANGDKDKDW